VFESEGEAVMDGVDVFEDEGGSEGVLVADPERVEVFEMEGVLEAVNPNVGGAVRVEENERVEDGVEV